MTRIRRTCISRRAAVLAVACLLSGCFKPSLTWDFSWKPVALPVNHNLAVPQTVPLGSTVRAHYHTMQANAEASDFILHRHEFVDKTAELTPAGKDHILEIASRMRSAPFPVLIERSENNSDPELDDHRRRLVAQILTDFGNPDAAQRTIVAPAYGRGLDAREAEFDYRRFLYTRGFNNFGGFGTGFGQYGGAGGGVGFGP